MTEDDTNNNVNNEPTGGQTNESLDKLSENEINSPSENGANNTIDSKENISTESTANDVDSNDLSKKNTPADFATTTDDLDHGNTDKLTLNDIDLPISELNDEDETSGGKKKWILFSSGIIVIAILSGAGLFFYPSIGSLTNNNQSKEVALSLEIPRQSKLKKGRTKMISSSQKLLQKGSKPLRSKIPSKLASQNSSKPVNKLNSFNNKNKPKKIKSKKNPPDPKKAITVANNKKEPTKANTVNIGTKILADGSLVIPSVTAAAFKGIPVIKDPRPLAEPDTSLGETMGGGVIPKISTDGRRPWKFYGKTFRKEKTLPRISIIITGLGLSRAATTAAINNTPSEVTLAFNPYAKGVGNWVALARGVGHETLIILPMEPTDFPISDPGPFALQVGLQKTENIDRLRYILSVSMGNIGLLQMMGTRFVSSTKALEPVLKEIHSRGLLIIDNGLAKNSKITEIASTIGLPRARSDIFLDRDASRSAILEKLATLESAANKNKSAIGIAHPLPNSISLIMNWAKTLDAKKIVLAPISAVAKISSKSQMLVNKPNLQTNNK